MRLMVEGQESKARIEVDAEDASKLRDWIDEWLSELQP
jgi:tRNA threonylcarbamoyladenosine modification (KEOPS) complex  Pcc1 subunit